MQLTSMDAPRKLKGRGLKDGQFRGRVSPTSRQDDGDEMGAKRSRKGDPGILGSEGWETFSAVPSRRLFSVFLSSFFFFFFTFFSPFIIYSTLT